MPQTWFTRLVLGVGIGLAAFGGTPSHATTLQEAIDQGALSPSTAAARHASDAAKAERFASFMAAWGVVAKVDANTVRRDEGVQLDLGAPPELAFLGSIPIVPPNRTNLNARVFAPLVRPEAAAQFTVATQQARAAKHRAVWATIVGGLAAANAWLDVHRVRALQRAAEANLASLRATEADLRARHAAQLIVQSDVLRVEVAVLGAEQELARLETELRLTEQALGAAMGRDEPVRPADELPTLNVPEPGEAPRADLLAADARLESARRSRRVAIAGALPSVEVFGGFAVIDQPNVINGEFFEVGVLASWTPFASGARLARRRAAGSRYAAAKADREQLGRNVSLEQERARSTVALRAELLELRRAAVTQAQTAQQQLSARARQGLATVTDVLSVQAELYRVQSELEVAHVEYARAIVQYRAALGTLAPDF